MRDLITVLAEPNRRRILELLRLGEHSVTALAEQFGVTRSAISQHLGVLVESGLVSARQEGRFRYYRLVPDGMVALRAALDAFWTVELDDLVTSAQRRKRDRQMKLEKSVLVPLGPDETFALLTEPERLRRWQAVTARVDLRAGGEYRWTIAPGHSAVGTFVEIEPGRRLVYTWGWEGSTDTPPGSSSITVTLEPSSEGTLVRLVHEGLTDEQAVGHNQGWDHYLGRLVAAANNGDAGPDDWAAAPEPMDVLNAAEAALAVCQQVLRRLETSDRERQTPCTDFTVHQLVEHLHDSLERLGRAAGLSEVSAVRGSAEGYIAAAAQETLEAWRERGLNGTVDLGVEMPAAFAANILVVELLVHAWDLATATSQSIPCSDELAAYVLDLSRQLIEVTTRSDRFAAEVMVGPDARPVERLAGFTGRQL